jgi:hypothetical protein
MSAVMTVSALSLSGFSSFAETGDSPEQTVDTQDKEIEYGGIFGSMLSDEIDESVQEKQKAANMEYTVFKVFHDHDTARVGVTYRAKTDCTLFIGFYNDEGTELITSVTKDLDATEDGYMETYTLDALPDHYLIKCFIVGKEVRNPLSKPCVYDKYTQRMQEILAKTTVDFDKEQIINLDQNNSNNFFVLQKGVIKITPTESTDIYKGEDENGNYVFEKPSEIANLKKGDKVCVLSDPNIVAFVVDKVIIEGDTAIIPKTDFEMSEIISFVKIDSNEYKGKSTAIVHNDDEHDKFEYKGVSTPEPSSYPGRKPVSGSLYCPPNTKQFEFELDTNDIPGGDKDYLGSAFGKFNMGVTTELEIYYDVGILDTCISVVGSAEFTMEFTAGLKINHEFDKLPEITLFTVVGASLKINIIPEIRIEGELHLKYSKRYDFDKPALELPTLIAHDPEIIEFDGGVNVEIKIKGKLSLGILWFDALSLSPYAGVRFEIHDTDGLLTNEKAPSYIQHDCKNCVTFDLSIFFGVEISIDVINYTLTLGETEIPLWTGHFSDDSFATGECHNYSHKIAFTVKSYKDKKPINNAKFYIATNNGAYKMVTNLSGTPVTTNSDGKAEFWVKDSTLNNETSRIKVVATSGESTICDVGKEYAPDYSNMHNFPIRIDLEAEYQTSFGSSDPDEKKEGSKEEYSKEEQKEITPKHIVCGYKLDDNGDYVKDQNGNMIPSVFCTIYPDENSTDPTHPYQSVGYISGSGTITSAGNIPEIVKKIVVIDPETKLRSCSFGNSHFESIDLSAMTVERIPYGTFNNCKNLKEVILPSSVKRIDEFAFGGCINITQIDLPDGLNIIDKFAFQATGLTKFTCPPALMAISNNAFLDCTDLREITLNLGLGYIGDTAFQGTSIQIINIPESASEISNAPFADCDNLRTVIFNRDVVQIDEFEVDEKGKFSYNIVRDNSDRILCLARNLRQAIFNEGVTKINAKLFVSNKNLTSVSLPSTLKTIEDYAFYGTNLSNVKLPEGLESIGDYAFASTNLVNVTIPNSVTVIGENAFDNEKEWDEATLKYVPRDITLKSITINNPDCKIDTGAFREGKDLTVYGHTGSTAEAFAKSNGNTFISIDKPQTTKPAATATTTKTTTVTTTTVTTTVTASVSTIIGPDKECLFIVVKDPATATEAYNDKLLDVDNVAYIDQQTADDKGKVTFSFIPDAVKDLAYLFISEINYSKINKTVVNGTDVQTTWYPATDPSVTVYGDSNNDGVVELADAILIMQQMANPDKYALNGSSQYCITEQGMINGDVYEPGSGLTGNDALTIQEYLLGKRDNLVRY